jgi:hypothetical protein
MYRGVGDDSSTPVYGPTLSQLGIETVQGDLTTQIQGATPGVQSYIADLENWVNASGTSTSSTSSSSMSTYLLIGAAVIVGALVLFGGGGRR